MRGFPCEHKWSPLGFTLKHPPQHRHIAQIPAVMSFRAQNLSNTLWAILRGWQRKFPQAGYDGNWKDHNDGPKVCSSINARKLITARPLNGHQSNENMGRKIQALVETYAKVAKLATDNVRARMHGQTPVSRCLIDGPRPQMAGRSDGKSKHDSGSGRWRERGRADDPNPLHA